MGYEQLCRRISVHATTSQNPVKILRSYQNLDLCYIGSQRVQ